MFARLDTSKLDARTDADLVRRSQAGDEHALAVLLSRHWDGLYQFCCSITATREDAEDICQEAITRAIMRVDTLQSNAAFRSWLFSIAKNLSVDSHRSRKRVAPLEDEELPLLPATDGTPHDAIEAHEELQTVASALGRLRQRHQRVLMLREVEQLSYADIAEELDVSESAVETLLFRARRRLREEYSRCERPTAGIVALGSLRGLLLKIGSPLTGASPLAAKLALTGALVAGSTVVAPVVLRNVHPSHPRPGAPRLARESRSPGPAVNAPAGDSMGGSAHTVAALQTASGASASRHLTLSSSLKPSLAPVIRRHAAPGRSAPIRSTGVSSGLSGLQFAAVAHSSPTEIRSSAAGSPTAELAPGSNHVHHSGLTHSGTTRPVIVGGRNGAPLRPVAHGLTLHVAHVHRLQRKSNAARYGSPVAVSVHAPVRVTQGRNSGKGPHRARSRTPQVLEPAIAGLSTRHGRASRWGSAIRPSEHGTGSTVARVHVRQPAVSSPIPVAIPTPGSSQGGPGPAPHGVHARGGGAPVAPAATPALVPASESVTATVVAPTPSAIPTVVVETHGKSRP